MIGRRYLMRFMCPVEMGLRGQYVERREDGSVEIGRRLLDDVRVPFTTIQHTRARAAQTIRQWREFGYEIEKEAI
jgi:hypothetical protein